MPESYKPEPHEIILGLRLADAREEAGMKQPEVAKALDVQATTVSKWENAKAGISLPMVARLAKLYNKPIGYMFAKHKPGETLCKDDLIRDAIIRRIEKASPVYLDLLEYVVTAFEDHETEKGVVHLRSLLEETDKK